MVLKLQYSSLSRYFSSSLHFEFYFDCNGMPKTSFQPKNLTPLGTFSKGPLCRKAMQIFDFELMTALAWQRSVVHFS